MLTETKGWKLKLSNALSSLAQYPAQQAECTCLCLRGGTGNMGLMQPWEQAQVPSVAGSEQPGWPFGAARRAVCSRCNTVSERHDASLTSLHVAEPAPFQLHFIYLYQELYCAQEPTPDLERRSCTISGGLQHAGLSTFSPS